MKRVIAFSCLHAPITDQDYFNWLIRQIEEFKPDHLVNLGDWYEAKAAKRWARHKDETWSLEDEHLEVARQAKEFSSRVENCTWIYGNHDDNLFGDQPDRIDPDLKACIHWRGYKSTAAALESWKVIEDYSNAARYRLGQVTFQHGTLTNQSSEKDASYTHGVPFGLYVCGHTHRPVEVTQARERQHYLPYWYANPGFGADDTKMHYMDRLSKSLWGRGCIMIEISARSITQGKVAYTSPQWSAELRVHSYCAENRRVFGRIA